MKCKKCRFYIFSTTLGSPVVPLYHCRQGFTPSEDCFDEAMRNIRISSGYFFKRRKAVQLSLW